MTLMTGWLFGVCYAGWQLTTSFAGKRLCREKLTFQPTTLLRKWPRHTRSTIASFWNIDRRHSLNASSAMPVTIAPSAGQPFRQTAEDLNYRFLRSQPCVIGPGSLRKARPSGATPPYHVTRHLEHQEQLRPTRPQLAQAPCDEIKQSRLRPTLLAGFEVTTEAYAG